VALTVDGSKIEVAAGTSIMRAALEAGIAIPKLCATDSLASFGSCRVCLVEVAGRNGLPAACTTLVEPGMVVQTRSDKLARVRRNVVELYISDHPLDCLSCAANGDCELQDVAAEVGLNDSRYGVDGVSHADLTIDQSNPYFNFDPAKCIVCSRCVRACEETQGTFALTVNGRGFASKIAASEDVDFFDSECVSCGACVAACPTATLIERTVVERGLPTRSVDTTCAYCGVGCSLRAELQGDDVLRMVPLKDGGANEGHACVKGRFAWGYATHSDRVLKPLVREDPNQDWREVSWDEAIEFAAARLKRAQAAHGRHAIGGISSSRCTNEEVFVVQKMVRAAFGNNNIDTCARVCHSPTGYGLKQTFGTSAGTQDFTSVAHADAILLIGANPTDAHPVFASRLKRRLREGAQLIVVDPRRIDLVRSPHVQAACHLPVLPGANVAVVNALAHVVVSEGLVNEEFVAERCDTESFARWRRFIEQPRHAPEQVEAVTGVSANAVRKAARLYASAENGAIYYGLGVTEHSQGSTMVMGMANLAMATGNIGRDGVGVNPLRGQNNVQGACDMGSFPHELPGYRHVSDASVRADFESAWRVSLDPEPGLRIPNMFAGARAGQFRAMFIQGEDVAQSDPDTLHVQAALAGLDCLIVQDLFLNETAQYAHVFFPGTSFLEKDGTFTNAERRINRVRPVTEPRTGLAEWQVVCRLSTAMGYPMDYAGAADIMQEIAALTPTFAGVSFAKLDREGSVQWPCPAADSAGTRIMHESGFVRGLGQFMITEYVPTEERATRRFPLILTTGRILSQYNVGAQTRRTENSLWHEQDVLEIHEADAELRGVGDGDRVLVSSRKGATILTAQISDRVPAGVVHTTFHHPESEANVVTTEFSDWATNCPEYKVTAVQVLPSNEAPARALPG
jgi:formate dehydrogenase major subunit